MQSANLASLKADIAQGVPDIAAGRVRELDMNEIKRRGNRQRGRLRKVRHSASVENVLLETWLHIAEGGVDAVDRLPDQIETETRTLLTQPKTGGRATNWRPAGTVTARPIGGRST